jgi:hypothetical protein
LPCWIKWFGVKVLKALAIKHIGIITISHQKSFVDALPKVTTHEQPLLIPQDFKNLS